MIIVQIVPGSDLVGITIVSEDNKKYFAHKMKVEDARKLADSLNEVADQLDPKG